MGLAGPKNKQRIGLDPQNKTWSDDKNKAGFRMLEKMGWKDGQGLGKSSRGMVSHVKVSKKQDNYGIGADTRTVDNWLDNASAFSDVLSNLNKQNDSLKVVDGQFVFNSGDETDAVPAAKLESRPKSALSGQRLAHRKKFIKAKNVSNYSSNDMAAILGVESSIATTISVKETASLLNNVKNAGDSEESEVHLISKTTCTNDYFASKQMNPKLKALLMSRLAVKDTAKQDSPAEPKELQVSKPVDSLKISKKSKKIKKTAKEI